MRLSKILIPACVASVCSGAAVALEERNICNVADPVYSLLKKPLQAIATSLCSSYLGYPRKTSVTVTATAATVTQTSTLPPSTVTTQTTETDIVSNTATVTVTDTQAPVLTTTTVTAPTHTTYNKRDNIERRTLPAALAVFAASKISSACSCIVTPTTKTTTVTAPNTSTATVTSTVPATYTVTITQTVDVVSLVTTTVTSDITAPPVTSTVTSTVTPILVKPKICNAKGLPGDNAFNYNANFNSNQADCIASCKTDSRCLSTGFYIVTDPSTGATSGTCRYYDKSVADSDDLGPGYYNFNDKAC